MQQIINITFIEIIFQIIRLVAIGSFIVLISLMILTYIANTKKVKFPLRKYFLNNSSVSRTLDITLGGIFAVFFITAMTYVIFH